MLEPSAVSTGELVRDQRQVVSAAQQRLRETLATSGASVYTRSVVKDEAIALGVAVDKLEVLVNLLAGEAEDRSVVRR